MPREQNARPSARGKKRGGGRSDDPLEKLTRKLDKWIDKNPMYSGVLTAFLFALIAFLFWNMFGETLKWAYEKYLAERLNPLLAKHVTPHFVALGDVLKEKVPFAEKVTNLFAYRDVKVSGNKEL